MTDQDLIDEARDLCQGMYRTIPTRGQQEFAVNWLTGFLKRRTAPEAADTKDAERWRTHVRLLRAKHPPVVVEQLLKAVDEHLPQQER
jgi:hypothetical protein